MLDDQRAALLSHVCSKSVCVALQLEQGRDADHFQARRFRLQPFAHDAGALLAIGRLVLIVHDVVVLDAEGFGDEPGGGGRRRHC